MPPGPTISTSRSLGEQVGQGGDLRLASDELGRHRRQVPGRRASSSVGRAIGTPSDASWTRICCSSCCSSRSRVEAELVGQQVPDPLVGRQRVGLASGPVQRGDQQLPQAFLERVRRHGRFQLADHVADVAEPQPRRELGLDELHPCLVEPRPVRRRPTRRRRRLAGPPRDTAASADALRSAAPRSSPASSKRDAAAAWRSTASASTSDGSTASL